MSLKSIINGVEQVIPIPAPEVQVLDLNGNYENSDLENILKEVKANHNTNSNKIGDLTGNGLTEADLATAIKNDRSQLSDMTNILKHLGWDFLKQGGIADGVTDNRALLQSLMDTLNTMGGGNIYIPDGEFFFGQDGSNEWSTKCYSNVNVYGAGIGKTILKIGGATVDGYSLFWYKPTVEAGNDSQAIENITYRDFTVDGYDMTMEIYSHKGKAFYFQGVKNAIFENLDLRGTPSTALGIDFLHNVHMIKVNCTECGRLWEEAWTNGGTRPAELGPGGAGIGIGTGQFENENFTISDCVCVGCGHFGIFLEHQAIFAPTWHTQDAKGVTISNCVVTKSRYGGFGIRGGSNISVSNLQCYENKLGMRFDCGGSGHDSLIKFKNISLNDCAITDNTTYGVMLTGDGSSDTFVINGGVIANNGDDGLILGKNGQADELINNFKATNVDILNNVGYGVNIYDTVPIDNITIDGNRINNNGKDGIKDLGNILKGKYTDNEILNNVGAGILLPYGEKKHLNIERNKARDTQTIKTQMYGINQSGGTLNYCTIRGNDFRRNGTKSMSIVDSAILSTTYVRENLTDDTGMLALKSTSYASFPSALANFNGSASISIRLKFKILSFDPAGVSVKSLLLSHTKDSTVTSNPQGWNLYVNGSYQLVLDVRQSDGSTLIQRVGTTVLTTGTTYNLLISIGATTTFTINDIAETFSSSTETDANLLTAMQNNNTAFPLYLDGGYYNGVLKNADTTNVILFNVVKPSATTICNFDNYGTNRTIFDSVIGLHGNGIGGIKQVDNYNDI